MFDPISLIVGVTINLYTLNNIEFFHQRNHNNRTMTCRWEFVCKSVPKSKNPSLTLFGNVYYKQNCIDKKYD